MLVHSCKLQLFICSYAWTAFVTNDSLLLRGAEEDVHRQLQHKKKEHEGTKTTLQHVYPYDKHDVTILYMQIRKRNTSAVIRGISFCSSRACSAVISGKYLQRFQISPFDAVAYYFSSVFLSSSRV